jgi:hypothetical protein
MATTVSPARNRRPGKANGPCRSRPGQRTSRDASTDQLQNMLPAHRIAHARRLEAYQALDRQLAQGASGEQRVTLAFGISYETAVLRWFDRLPASMNPNGSTPTAS